MVSPSVKAMMVQGLAGTSASLTMMSTGIIYAWMNPVLSSLLSADSPVPMTSLQASWVACLPDLGTLLTTIPAGFLADYIGRKTLLLGTTPLTLIGWVIIFFTSNVYVLMMARTLQGLAMGLWSTAFPLYLTEIADPSLRGSLCNLYVIAFALGHVYIFAIGPFVTYSTLAVVGAIPSGVFLISFVWFYESPYFLLMKGKYDKAKIALRWFRGGHIEDGEFKRIKRIIQAGKGRDETWKIVATTSVGRKAVIITAVIGTAVFLGGFTVMLSYSSVIFYRTVNLTLAPYIFTLIMGVLMTVAAVFCSVMLDMWGRRPVLLLSQFGNSLCLTFAAIYYILRDSKIKVESLGLPTVIMIIIASVLSLLGMCAINVYQAEVFSTPARAVGTGICSFICGVMSAIALFIYIPLDDMGLVYVNFIIFSVVSLAGAIFIYIGAPETKGETLEHIQDLLKNRTW